MKWTEKLKRSVKELIGGSKTYMPKKAKKKIRTRSTEAGMKAAGLTAKEIARFGGK